jgi:hypothetical protein
MFKTPLWSVAVLAVTAGVGQAQTQESTVAEYLSHNGCVVGPRGSAARDMPTPDFHGALTTYAEAALERGEADGAPVTVEVARALADVTNGAAVNAWTMMDRLVLAIGAGWVEGLNATERGTPRPPICSYGN